MKFLSPKLYFAVAALTCLFPLAGCASNEIFTTNGKPTPLKHIPTPFKQYDRTLFDTIQKNWYDLLADQKVVPHKNVKVVLQFHLQYDGNITDIKILENNAGDDQALVCQKAILASAPYKSWPEDMKRMIGANYRLITISFYY